MTIQCEYSVGLVRVSPTFASRSEFDNIPVSFQDSEAEPELLVHITIFFDSS
jgi:hypothetical protein